jgi:hypothetical protein
LEQGIKQTLGEPGYRISAVTADRRLGRATLLHRRVAAGRGKHRAWRALQFDLLRRRREQQFHRQHAAYDIGSGWGAFASYRRGWTNLPGSGALVRSGALATDAWSFDLAKSSAFSAGDKLAFRVMQPLRVRSGGFNLSCRHPTTTRR